MPKAYDATKRKSAAKPAKSNAITTTLRYERSTKGTHVFCNDEDGAPVPTLYIKRNAFDAAFDLDDEMEITISIS